MSREQVCETCAWWDREVETGVHGQGVCRLRPPLVRVRVQTFGREVASALKTCWPETGAREWCGEWAS